MEVVILTRSSLLIMFIINGHTNILLFAYASPKVNPHEETINVLKFD